MKWIYCSNSIPFVIINHLHIFFLYKYAVQDSKYNNYSDLFLRIWSTDRTRCDKVEGRVSGWEKGWVKGGTDVRVSFTAEATVWLLEKDTPDTLNHPYTQWVLPWFKLYIFCMHVGFCACWHKYGAAMTTNWFWDRIMIIWLCCSLLLFCACDVGIHKQVTTLRSVVHFDS